MCTQRHDLFFAKYCQNPTTLFANCARKTILRNRSRSITVSGWSSMVLRNAVRTGPP